MERMIVGFPFILTADDYHEFTDYRDLLRRLTGSNRIKIHEVMTQYPYVAIAYTRKDKDFYRTIQEVEARYGVLE